MSWSIAVLVRLALSAVFLVSAGSKLATAPARTAFAEAVTVFGAVPARWSRVAAGFVVLIELAAAVGLCVNQLSRPALYGAAALLLAFAIALWVGLQGSMIAAVCGLAILGVIEIFHLAVTTALSGGSGPCRRARRLRRMLTDLRSASAAPNPWTPQSAA